jgi:hypothetical protein
MFGLKEWMHDYNHDMRGMMSYTIYDKKFVTDNIRIRHTTIRMCIREHPYSNLNKNMKINIVLVISVRIRFDYIPNYICIILPLEFLMF